MKRRNVITVHHVAEELGLEVSETEMMAVGAAVQRRYSAANKGELPPKDNFRKRNGPGSHCFAYYNRAEWFDVIRQELIRIGARKAAQPSMFE